MEKALNILKDLCLVLNFNSYWKPRVDEAIAELEEAMKPKTCSTCEYLRINEFNEWADYCKELRIEISDSTKRTFYCNRYEPKEKL